MIKLKAEWKKITRKAWSMRLMAVAGVFSTAESVLPLWSDSIPRGAFAGLTLVAVTGAMIARVVVQKELGDE